MHRLFFALVPGEALRQNLAEVAHQRAQRVGGRPLAPDRYHMTLQFIGDFETVAPAFLESLMAGAAAVVPPTRFEIGLDQIGSFGAGRVVWLGCRTPSDALMRLHRQLADALHEADVALTEARGFVPHVTLLRNASPVFGESAPMLHWRIEDFVLIDAADGVYRHLGRWTLAQD